MTESVKEVREDSEDLVFNYLKKASLDAKAIAAGFLNGFALAEMCQRIKEQNE